MKQIPERLALLRNPKPKSFFLAILASVTLISIFSVRNLWFANGLLAQATPDQNSLPDDLVLPLVHPDEPAEYTFNERLSEENALNSLSQIRNALASFQELTIKVQDVLEMETLHEVGNTDWEVQNLGFFNWMNAAEGTIKKQDYQIKKLELALARKQYQDGEIDQASLVLKEKSYATAKQNFQEFWKSLQIGD